MFGKKSTPTTPAMVPCPRCGAEIPADATQCPACFRDPRRPPSTSGAPQQCAVPFWPRISRSGDEARECAAELNQLVDYMSARGWRYARLENITTMRDNGCIAALFGNPTSVVVYQVAVFERV